MTYEIKGMPFQYVCEIIPELDEGGVPEEYIPQSRYENTSNIPLHDYGRGPFCRFKVSEHKRKTGVYVILVDGNPRYVGECEKLGMRFNTGYGNISPRNCYTGGQPTNCRINTLILETYKGGSKIELLFHETKNRFRIEEALIKELNPEWNRTAGKSLIEGGNQGVLNRRSDMSKYYVLGQYLRNSQKQAETLSYDEIEGILGFRLPPSAYNHRPWWANGGHSQANSWLNAGWRVSSVGLGTSVTFTKMGEIKAN